MDPDSCVLAADDASPLRLTFHRTARVGDHEDPSKQTVATAVEHSAPCRLTRWPPDGDDPTYLLALDCPAGRALAELDAFGIRAWTSHPTEEGIKLEIKVEGENVASPPLYRWEQTLAPAERRQDYFVLSEAGEEWIHGIAVKEEPRLVRQFVVRNDGTGASIQQQVTGEAVPEMMGVVEIEATVAPRSSEVVGSSTASSGVSPSRNSLAAVSRTADPCSDECDASLDEPAHGSSASLPEPKLRPTASSDASVPPSPPVEENHLFVKIDSSFTIRQDDGTVTVKHVVERLRVDNFSFGDVPSFLKHLAVESLRRYLSIGPKARVTTGSDDIDALAIDSFDLVDDDQVLNDSGYLKDYYVYQGCTLEMVYRTTPGADQVKMGNTMDYGPSDTCLRPVSDDEDILTPDLGLPISLDPRRCGTGREEMLREDSAQHERVYIGESEYEVDREEAELRYDIERIHYIRGRGGRRGFERMGGDRTMETRFERRERRESERRRKRLYEIERASKVRYELDAGTTESEYEPDIGKLEILPGGLIAQPLSKDPGTYDWASRQKSKLTVRIVNFEQFRSLTGREPPEPPLLPRGARLPRRDARNPEGTDSMLASNAEHQFQHQPSPDEFGTSSSPSGSRQSTFSGKGGGRKPDGGGAGIVQNLAVPPRVPEKPSRGGATSPPADGGPSRGVSNVTSNDTTGHTASTDGLSGGGKPRHPPSKATTGKGEVSGSKEQGDNGKVERASGSCSCCTCM